MSSIANRQALQAAEDDVLRHSGLVDSKPRTGHKAMLRSRRWRRSGAIAVARAVAWAIRYPLHTVSMRMQFGGAHRPLLACDIATSARQLWHGLPLGAVYQRSSNWHIRAAGQATILLGTKSTTLLRTLFGIFIHYVAYASMYGLFRQSVTTRLLGAHGSMQLRLVYPAITWIRDLLLLRSPRGSVFGLYVRDMFNSTLQGVLSMVLTRTLTSQSAIPVYRCVERVDTMWQRVLGLTRRAETNGMRPDAVEASADARAMFRRAEDQLVQMHDSGDELTMDRAVVDRQAMRSVEFLVYTQAVAAMLSAAVVRAVLYPIDSVFVRLMADEAGLTSYAYSGFFNCLHRVCGANGVRVLYAGFSTAVASDLALTWLAAEAMHFLLRSRSERDRAKDDTRNKFDKLRRLRAAGRSAAALSDEENSEGDDLYEKVDEDEYQQRLQTTGLDDFVVDDDGAGYADNGEDDIGASSSFAGTREQTQLTSKSKRSAAKQSTRKAQPTLSSKDKGKGNIGAMFKTAQLKSLGTSKTPKKAVDDEEFMASLMDDLQAPQTPSRSAKQHAAKKHAAGSYSVNRRIAAARGRPAGPTTPKPEPVHVVDISDPAMDPFAASPHPTKKARSDMDDPFAGPSASVDQPVLVEDVKPQLAELEDELDMADDALLGDDAMLDVADDALLDGLDALEDECALSKPALYAEDSQPLGQSWMDVQLEMAKHPSLPRQQSTASDITMDPRSDTMDPPSDAMMDTSGDVVHMYWIDALEKNGSLYVIGKEPFAQGFRSCCVKVSGLERNVFVLPRINAETGERFSALDVHKEFESLAMRQGVRSFACKPVERKYAFEMSEVPASAEYLKVAYGFDQPALRDDMSGTTFERVFGTTYSALELFLLKRRVMGPCWLRIQGAQAVDRFNRVSWCRTEYTVDDPKDVHVMDDAAVEQSKLARVPPLTTVTMSLKTVMNHRDRVNEVVAVSMLVHRDVSLDDSTPAAQRQGEQLTVVRQLTGMPLPSDFVRAAQAQSRRGLVIEAVKTEAALLSALVAHLQRVDPDVLAAHNFYGFDLDVLLHRMRALRTDGWSRLGRLQRTQWPKLQAGGGGMGESTYAERQIVCGRVVCDTYLASKDLIRAKSFTLTSLASQELQIRRDEIPFERIPEYFGSSKSLLLFLRHTAFDAFLAAALMVHLQILPLTKQLTTLAGNLWSRTLVGARAERNEFLLLHEFYRSKFIRPDKFFGARSQTAAMGGTDKAQAGGMDKTKKGASLSAEMAEASGQMDENAEGEVQVAEKSGRRKPAYLGGLVLEPKSGFYDRFVLLLDFNSLYPSIIQEYNICFTTVRRPANTDSVPDAPGPDLPTGILPRLLKTLVDRRRQVKQLLKRAVPNSEEAGQLDVRQQALKLTANSMYGCLGFTHSRFYAKQLAMLITLRGREILQATRDLALADGLEVIYGDTDSIMIATQTDALKDVYEMGAQFKRRVNERYKLLELDIDGVFQRLLLLKKKKYAALVIVNPQSCTSGRLETKLETKGLDLVRRDWCGLSHDVSDFVLKRLFADVPKCDNDENAVVAEIHEHLARVGAAVRAQRVPLDKYAIHKGLTKAPESYGDKSSQPHVLVALQMRAKGTAVRSGDTVPYVICAPHCVPAGNGSYAERARHVDEVRESNGSLVPDPEWYLNQQVLPPCARLLESLDGTDMATLAQCLGLDAAKFRAPVHNAPADELRTLDSQIPDSERFKHARSLCVPCPTCKSPYDVHGIARATSRGIVSGLACPACNYLPASAQLATRLTMLIRSCIREYHAFAVQCDEPSCALTTRLLTVCGAQCVRPQCSGRMAELYSDKALYEQLQYFAALLNVERVASRLNTSIGDIRALRDSHAEHITRMSQTVDSYLSVSARKYVDLASLFSFCSV
ncbi:DNA-directed DNA polymerase alpha catalytic subunit pol1 [Coemansia sp. RSA 1822]|nr:DNA-directed DNA polymerase alpha catalytic subunit pol1 [Coemansia sp. RSA 638]KAJ2558221.1 DNA-directed DNA polymerase alpha catalytic subunit pol1 [Coemansia sp. RSA 1822]